ncbi:MAG: hypothetical protein COB36_10220 [Alphaproteobacteria bacterium]|nr:MAG: hypothetical protein COB36_10220 [Alphaproteobacteria bacterium]
MKNTKNKLKCSVAFVMALAGFIPTQSVFAIEEGSELALEEIIVTAQKRSERLQDVALSISAFSEKNIQDANITQIKDLSMLTPGLEFSETIGRQTTAPSIRGVAPLGFADPTVLVYVDGFTLGFTRSENNAQLFDLERIEVLKGPQATLYGRNALGGVVNYITKKPGNEFEGSVKGEYGRFNNFEIAGTAGGAVIEDKVFLQAGIGYRESGGFLDNEFDGANDVNDESDFNARVNMRFTPSDQLEVNLTVNYSKVDDACGDCAHVPVEWTGSRLDVGAGLVDFNNISNTVNMDRLGSYENEVFSFVSKVEYDMDWATLTNIAGFAKGEQMLVADFTRSPGPFGPFEGFTIRRDNKGWSEELRLASNGDEKLTWLVGFYAFKNNRTGQVFLDFDGGGILYLLILTLKSKIMRDLSI